MIPHIPNQRNFKSKTKGAFDDLNAYIEGDLQQEVGRAQGPERVTRETVTNNFDDIVNYATASTDKDTKAEKCIAIRTSGIVGGIETATVEMNTVARKNHRCKDPAYHIILSWPEHEQPAPELIFDAAEHALKALGLAEHQYVLAIHGNTDNMHCHISVNRVHPGTFKSRNIEWAVKTLHLAARQSEIKHGWTHDNGIYIVKTNGHGKKEIVLHPEFGKTLDQAVPRVHRDLGSEEEVLPSWHDPQSLDSWLKTKVAKALKHALPDLESWVALHAWLSPYGITLSDNGGGGMRLHATSPETGEVLDLAASKGLRLLKRGDLEKRWGPFHNSVEVPCTVPDFSDLSPADIAQGVEDVINNALDNGRPPEHILRAQQRPQGVLSEGTSGLHELPSGGLDVSGQDGGMLLPGAVPNRVGNSTPREDSNLRRTRAREVSGGSQGFGAGGKGDGGTRQEGLQGDGRRGEEERQGFAQKSQRSLNRNDAQRAQRKEERAAAREDLRQRFAQYRRFVRAGDTEHFLRLKDLKDVRSATLELVRKYAKAAKSAMPRSLSMDIRLVANVEIDAESLRRKLQAEAQFQASSRSLKATRTAPLSWRAWLFEQANLGDQAALSALRGIVYQAQRDAKKSGAGEGEEEDLEAESEDARERQFSKVMARLLDEEQKEAAIRSARSYSARPYEADALLARYGGLQWRVTGNGNVQYSDVRGQHLFTDRGNRVTFDRVRVTDEEIQLALAHSKQKFGNKLTLTGTDVVFTQRMACLADDLGMVVLNPELRVVIAQHREDRLLEVSQAAVVRQAPARPQPMAPALQRPVAPVAAPDPTVRPDTIAVQPTEHLHFSVPEKTTQERLRDKVLAIDPRATFEVADPMEPSRTYLGPIAAALDAPDECFAQHTGRSVYALHAVSVPTNAGESMVEVNYRSGIPTVMVQVIKGKGGTQI